MNDFKISIHKTTCSHEDDYISIEIACPRSGTEFFRGKMGFAEFAQAVTGLSRQKIKGELRLTERVGKFQISESRSVVAPPFGGSKNGYSEWIKENCQEEGWYVDPFMGSQNSVTFCDGVRMLNYRVFKFVDEYPKQKEIES